MNENEADLSTILDRIIEIDQRMARLESLSATEVDKLSAHINHLEDIARLKREIDERVQRLRGEIKDEGSKAKRSVIRTIAFIASILSVLGFFGGKYYAQGSFESIYEKEIGSNLEEIENEAEKHLLKIEGLKNDAVSNFEELQRNRLIVLQTDFGQAGHMVGYLKSMIYSSNPQARIDTITHNISKFSVTEASTVLWRIAEQFPDETIFLAMTDSGKSEFEPLPIVIRTESPVQYFVGLDNGIFDLVTDRYEDEDVKIFRLNDKKILEVLKKTKTSISIVDPDGFGSLEQLAFVASLLSVQSSESDITLEKVGDEINLKRRKRNVELVTYKHEDFKTRLNTHIIGVDAFGNVSTTATPDDMKLIGYKNESAHSQYFYVSTENHCCKENVDCSKPLQLVKYYNDVDIGSSLMRFDQGFLQLAINEGNFSEKYCVDMGQEAAICKDMNDCFPMNR